jgi:uncharacterized protein (DUF58 family)
MTIASADVAAEPPLVTEHALDAIELIVLRRLREYTLGDHRSRFHGPGFDYVGVRYWEPGDRLSAVDWPQSSLTNFSPLVVRDFEQPGTATVMVVADRSRSTRCGTDGVPIAATIAWTIGTLGLSAVFFQDSFGLVTFDRALSDLALVAPRLGRSHVMHCLDAYQYGRGLQPVAGGGHAGQSLAGVMRRTSLVAAVSDFLFDDADGVLDHLGHLNASHDVIVAIVDGAAGYELPRSSAGWVRVHDVETGRRRLVTRRAVRRLAAEARAWQDEVARRAADRDLDVVRIGADTDQAGAALAGLMAERRLRKQR